MDYPDPGDFLESDDYSVYENRYEDELEMMEENFKPKRNDNNNAKKGMAMQLCGIFSVYITHCTDCTDWL